MLTTTRAKPTAMATTFNPLQQEDDHLDASLQDFEPPLSPRQPFGYPSAHSGFLRDRRDSSILSSSEAADDDDDNNNNNDLTVSAGGYSPPAWKRTRSGERFNGFWPRNGTPGFGDGGSARGASRESSPEFESADEGGVDALLDRAARTRLPTGSVSPDKGRSPEPESRLVSTRVKVHESIDSVFTSHKESSENYIRFALRAEVQQRTEPIDNAIQFVRSRFRAATKSWSSMILSVLVAVLSLGAMRSLFGPADPRPAPDLIKVAGIARSFEPLIYFSENGVQQVGDLQATGVAVWDLGESVRSSNMTSAPIIVKELDDLSDSLKTLAIELTKFFANVDGDIDGILIVMDWARRELSQLQQLPTQHPLSSAFDNVHNLLSSAGILEDARTGTPTRLGALATSLFGASGPQRTRTALQRTFSEFLAVLEDAVSTELQHSLALFGLFEAIDRQFLNLARTVAREASAQDERHADLLASLWTRLLGPRAAELRKYERNRALLATVRDRTVRNKAGLLEHNGRLLALKAQLDALRRRLVSPLVRSAANGSAGLSIDDQVKGLEDVASYLEGVRARQKGKLLEMLYGSGSGSGAAAVRLDRRLD